MKKAILIISIFCAAAFAQQSPLGLHYPFGIPDFAVTGASSALGGGGTAVMEEQFGAALNPANAAVKDRSVFAALVSFDITNITDGDNSSSVNEYAPKLLSLIIPIGNAGNLSFGMQRRYSANLNFLTENSVNDEFGSKHSAIEIQRKGGLTAWQAGWAYKLNNGVALGVQYEKYFYSMDASDVFISEFRYNDSVSVPFRTSVTEREELRFDGDGIRVGLQVPVHDKVTVGIAAEYVFNSNNNGEYIREMWRSDGFIDSAKATPDTGKFTVELPPSINFGVAYRHDERLLFVADLHSTLWDIVEDNNTYRVAGSEYNTRTTFGVSFGARFVPAGNRIMSRYFEKIHYSAGVNYATLPHDADGTHEYSLSLGAGLPIPNEGGMIDVVVGFGRRVDGRFNDYAENIVRLQLGINGGRTWYQRQH